MNPGDRRRALLEDAALAAAAAALLWLGAVGFAHSLQAQGAVPADGDAPKPVLSHAAEKKLDQAIENDAVILGRFDAVMDELAIVKVRALRKPEVSP